MRKQKADLNDGDQLMNSVGLTFQGLKWIYNLDPNQGQ